MKQPDTSNKMINVETKAQRVARLKKKIADLQATIAVEEADIARPGVSEPIETKSEAGFSC